MNKGVQELIIRKENIHENRIKCSNTMQITLDDDFNVPDSKPDIDSIIKERGIVHIESVKSVADKADVIGALDFSLLYTENDKHIPVRMNGSMEFNEKINLSEDADNTYLTAQARLEDITVKAINSRKISVKAVVSITVVSEEIEDVSVGNDVDDIDEKDDIQILKNTINYCQLAVNQKDNLRIKESVNLTAGKPNIAQLLWEDIDIRSFNTRLDNNSMNITGQMNVFVMYTAQDDTESVQWFETTKDFEGTLDISGCNPDMVSYVKYGLVSTNVEVKPDYDGENREIAIELVIDMEVKAYEEYEQQIITDIYSPVKNVTLNEQKAVLRQLLTHNNSKCRVSERVKADEYVNMLQICNCTGMAQIDDISSDEEGILVEGAVVVNVFYITSDDNSPMGSMRTALPFSHKIQVKCDDIEKMEYTINPLVEDLSAVMTGSGEIEIKGSVSLDTICFQAYSVNGVMSCEITPFPENEFLKFPSIIGYIANGEETLWEIARKNHTTTSSIRKRNGQLVEKTADDMKVKKGEKLLLVKVARL